MKAYLISRSISVAGLYEAGGMGHISSHAPVPAFANNVVAMNEVSQVLPHIGQLQLNRAEVPSNLRALLHRLFAGEL